MSEQVATGGLMTFRYQNDQKLQLDPEKRREIREAYAKADERKRKEKLKKRIILGIIIFTLLILIGTITYFLIRP